MSDRGEHRAIRRVLIDGPDFQKLGAAARWAFVCLKLDFGVAGLEVRYPGALTQSLSQQTGLAPDIVDAALSELERGGWIRRGGNLVWIVGHLLHDPYFRADNHNHRMSLLDHINSLPRLPIVEDFILEHSSWCRPDEFTTKGMRYPSRTHSNGIAITENREQRTEDRKAAAARARGREVENSVDNPPVLFAQSCITALNQGMRDNPAIASRLNPVPHGHGPSFQASEKIRETGVDSEFARSTIYTRAKTFQPTGRNRQINSLSYLADAVIDDWERRAAVVDADKMPRPSVTGPVNGKRGPRVNAGEQQYVNSKRALEDIVT